MHILIVDDHVSLQMLLTAFLQELGYVVYAVNNGKEALRYLRQTTVLPNLMLLDVAMPVMTGWEFLCERERDVRLADIPVVMMTALGRFEHRDGVPGIVGYLDKPIDLAALETLLRAYAKPQLRAREVGASRTSATG
jgi:chemosensory pili system protein ChpA (sensor histidine kinase/response regulator)